MEQQIDAQIDKRCQRSIKQDSGEGFAAGEAGSNEERIRYVQKKETNMILEYLLYKTRTVCYIELVHKVHKVHRHTNYCGRKIKSFMKC